MERTTPFLETGMKEIASTVGLATRIVSSPAEKLWESMEQTRELKKREFYRVVRKRVRKIGFSFRRRAFI